MDEPTTLRALGALLTYPGPELRAALPEIGSGLAGARHLPRASRERLARLVAWMLATDGLDLEGAYVAQFDRGRATSLNLFEHVHGDTRDRGPAMVELKEIYARAGFGLATRELPDFLPVVLEYLSCRGRDEARAMLGDCAHVLRNVGETLRRRDSAYAAVFDALLAVAGEPGIDFDAPVEEPDAGKPEASIDEDWAEVPAFASPAADAGAPQVAEVRFVPRRRAAGS
ncbi:MAG: nitrate reductase molybdenum cofactor assembly chaperone [Burkholderiales bacterium]|jgi:nitrate reductase delta subunit|nr:nitrate reductase molybdenum cofactor assembly chaperone [Burkholderiales bacterium]